MREKDRLSTIPSGYFYGVGVLFGENDELLRLSPDVKARFLGSSEACPVVDRLIKERGAEEMAKRYASVIFWFGYLREELDHKGLSTISTELITPKKRLVGEPLGLHHDPDWIPTSLHTHVFRNHAAYQLPRLVTESIYRDPDPQASQASMVKTLDIFNKTLSLQPQDATELLVLFSEELANNSTPEDVLTILKRTLGTAKIKEDNLYTELNETLTVVEEKAPLLWEAYCRLSPKKREENNIYQKKA